MENKYLERMLERAPDDYQVYIDGKPVKTAFVDHYNRKIHISSEDFFQFADAINPLILPVMRTAAVAGRTM